ncbi:NPCBM/NEW2 domain protein OS=Lysinibacillus sphaericus OX=1421 GN=LS41612_04930 PE=4 SV=1 [Lysinibacillus sphaericus]
MGLSGEITLGDMITLTSLHAPNARITNLDGLQYAKNLTSLDISANSITDFSPLQSLGALDTITAQPQVVEVSSLTGPIATVENLVKGLDGQYLNPYQIGLRNTKTMKEIYVDVEQLTPNTDHFTIDLSHEEQGTYMLIIAYKLNEDTRIQLTYYVKN